MTDACLFYLAILPSGASPDLPSHWVCISFKEDFAVSKDPSLAESFEFKDILKLATETSLRKTFSNGNFILVPSSYFKYVHRFSYSEIADVCSKLLNECPFDTDLLVSCDVPAPDVTAFWSFMVEKVHDIYIKNNDNNRSI